MTELRRKKAKPAATVLFSLLFLLAGFFFNLALWYRNTYDVGFAELLYTLVSPLQGTSGSVYLEILKGCLLPLLPLVVVLVLVLHFHRQRRVHVSLELRLGRRRFYLIDGSSPNWPLRVLVLVLLCCSVVSALSAFRIPEWVSSRLDQTTIYEEHYVDPSEVNLTAPEEKKNLIYIYLESMETTYASQAEGGRQPVNYMPELTRLAQEHISFSQSDTLGGFSSVSGSGWTMGALFATTTGIPFSFPVEGNSMGERVLFASGATALGDILEADGYQQVFLCGSDGNFAGRKTYFQQHGNYNVFDLYSARDAGYIPQDYHVWWGYEDQVLFDIARAELLKLAESDQPFNFTLLTADAHHLGGYRCQVCPDDYENNTANVIACTDRQVASFVEWCMEQDFYEDTVVVIAGDHPRMDSELVAGVEYPDRRMYNCILNADVEALGGTSFRQATSLDLFPTVLSALGYTMQGDRLGLGTNLFSNTPTLAEEYGLAWLDEELEKYSDYYIRTFS